MSADLKMLESIQNTQSISREELDAILQTQDSFLIQELHKKAQQTATQIYGNKIYIRGLIEFTNYCKNNCYYCGIRNGNTKADRYRLTTEQILSCCKTGWNLGFRTFVLQGGEDPYYTDVKIWKNLSKDIVLNFGINNLFDRQYLDNSFQYSLGRYVYARLNITLRY